MVRVPGGVDHPDRHRSGGDDIPVPQAHSLPGERDLLGGGEAVPGAGDPGQLEPAAHVVVVNVGLQHPGDLDAEAAAEGDAAIDVSRRVDDHGDGAVGRDVRVVAEPRGLQGSDPDPRGLDLGGRLTTGGEVEGWHPGHPIQAPWKRGDLNPGRTEASPIPARPRAASPRESSS